MTEECDKDQRGKDQRGKSQPDQNPGKPDQAGNRETVTHFAAAGRGRPCPICGKPARTETRPFCSKRCADIDLGRWLGEGYRIPAVEPPDGADLDHDDAGPGPGSADGGRKSRE